ncbi:conserved hypothetical protein [Verrucomicrobia bacterium]|nr:conserved hypothetical protein [Verrucomicrobiota bacterium]
MIALASECLVFQRPDGESIACSPESLSTELLGESAKFLDSEIVRHAAKAVFYYFKHDLGRQSVSVGEFAQAMEKALRGLDRTAQQVAGQLTSVKRVLELDLFGLAGEVGGGELFFLPRLRAELREHLERRPQVLRFRGLRNCVKLLLGAQRWTRHCRHLEERILGYLDQCLSAEAGPHELALVVE